jgi:L-ribulokinase
VINAGGIPQRSEVLNPLYANVSNKPMLIPQSEVTSKGSAIFAAVAAGAFTSIQKAQEALCPKYRVVEPDPKATKVYQELYGMHRELYFWFGKSQATPVAVGALLPSLRHIAATAGGHR